MEVRIAKIDDVNELFELNASFENTTTLELMKQSLSENDNEIVCIATVDGKAVGYACGLIVKSMCYSRARADIETVYVKEKYRGQGIGKALIKCLENQLISLGIFHFHIITDSDNTKAQSLYTKIGYSKTGEILLDKSIDCKLASKETPSFAVNANESVL